MVTIRRYKEKKTQAFYERLVALGNPQALTQAGVFGAILNAFTKGFEGQPRPNYLTRNSAAWVAYYAGEDAAKRP